MKPDKISFHLAFKTTVVFTVYHLFSHLIQLGFIEHLLYTRHWDYRNKQNKNDQDPVQTELTF